MRKCSCYFNDHNKLDSSYAIRAYAPYNVCNFWHQSAETRRLPQQQVKLAGRNKSWQLGVGCAGCWGVSHRQTVQLLQKCMLLKLHILCKQMVHLTCDFQVMHQQQQQLQSVQGKIHLGKWSHKKQYCIICRIALILS